MAKKVLPPERFYALTVTNCEPALDGPYATEGERDAAARKVFNDVTFSPDDGDHISWMNIDANGEPNVGVYLDGDLEEETP